MKICLRELSRILGAIFCGLGLVQPSIASESNSITWAIYDLAPSYFVSGTPTRQTLGAGIGDSLLKQVIEALPEYDHKFSVMTVSRIMAEMRAQKPLCTLNVQLTPERAKVAYSTPLLITPGPQLVVKKRMLAQHQDWKGGVSLSSMTRDATLRGQYQAGRSFGKKLDEILHSPANVGLKSNSSASALNALRMLDRERADYTIEYPELVELSVQRKDISDNVTTVPILEGTPFIDSYVICTRSSWGLATLRRIDAELRKLAAKPEYRQSLERWLPEDEVRIHRGDYERFYRTRAKTLFCEATCP